MARFKLKGPIQPDSSDRELVRKTGTGMNREGDKHGRSIVKSGRGTRTGKDQERTSTARGRTRHVSYIMQRTCPI